MTRHDTTGTRALTVALICTAVLALVALVGIPVDEAGREIGVESEISRDYSATAVHMTSTTSTPTTSTTTPSTSRPATSTTVAPDTTAPSTAAVEPLAGGSCSGWADLVASYWPADQVVKACAVMACESGGDPNAVSPTSDFGLMQLNRVHRASFEAQFGPWDPNVFDPTANVAFAHQLWRSSGWQPWACA